jgi:sugar phosphate isomerase/epimerase
MIHAALLHSVSYSGTWGQQALSLDAFIDKAAELGYDGVMLMAKRPHLSVLDWQSPECRAELRRRIEERGLKRVCVAGYTNFTADIEHGEVPQVEMQVRHVAELAALAHSLGGNLVRIFTGYEHPAATYGAQWRTVVRALKECAQRAAEFSVTIGVQNHHDIANHYLSLRDLIAEAGEPNCRAMFDPWAPALQGGDLAEAARQMAPISVHATFADYQLRPRFNYMPDLVNYQPATPAVRAVPMGQGMIDNRLFLATLEASGFDGTVAYEMCSPLDGGGSMENLDRCARLFLDFLAPFRN